MYSCDFDGTLQEYNEVAAQLWGRAPRRGDTDEKFCGSLKLHLIDGTLLPHAQTPAAAVLKGEIPAAHDFEVIIERPDGSRITVIANVVPIKSANGEITGTISCLYDITERSRLERKTQEQAAALADLDRRKDEFLAMLAHELRNPLAPISMAAELLKKAAANEGLVRESGGIIERQVLHMTGLVDDLLDVSRVARGLVELQKEEMDLRQIVSSAVSRSSPCSLRAGTRSSCKFPRRRPWCAPARRAWCKWRPICSTMRPNTPRPTGKSRWLCKRAVLGWSCA